MLEVQQLYNTKESSGCAGACSRAACQAKPIIIFVRCGCACWYRQHSTLEFSRVAERGDRDLQIGSCICRRYFDYGTRSARQRIRGRGPGSEGRTRKVREVLYWWDSDWHTCALSLVRQLSALTQWQLSPLRSRLLTLRCEDILLYYSKCISTEYAAPYYMGHFRVGRVTTLTLLI